MDDNDSLSSSVRISGSQTTMPRLGFGVYQIASDVCQDACTTALALGYRHIDCAQLYRSEAAVGAAVQQSSVQRADVFLTTKVSRAARSSELTYRNLVSSVEALGGPGGYVDLFLIHVARFGGEQRRLLWLALERLHDEGRAKAIGVSNFAVEHIEEMKDYARVWPPHVNQIELHPWCQQRELVQYCEEQGIVIQAYSPLARGCRLDDPSVIPIAEKHNKSSAQVLLRFSLQKGWVALVKSTTLSRIRENSDVFDFKLEDDDMAILSNLDLGSAGAQFPANIR